MRNNFFYELKYHFQKYRKIYLLFILFFLIGIIVGIFISISSDSYFSLLTSKDKVFLDYVNGKVDFAKESTKTGLNLLVFQLVVFVLNLNFYLGLLSYLLISYQSTVLFLTLSAIITQYGFGGVLKVVFLIFPVNIVIVLINVIFAGFCISRSFEAKKSKRFSYAFDDKRFWLMVVSFVVFSLVFSYLITLVLLMILKRRSFIVF